MVLVLKLLRGSIREGCIDILFFSKLVVFGLFIAASSIWHRRLVVVISFNYNNMHCFNLHFF